MDVDAKSTLERHPIEARSTVTTGTLSQPINEAEETDSLLAPLITARNADTGTEYKATAEEVNQALSFVGGGQLLPRQKKISLKRGTFALLVAIGDSPELAAMLAERINRE